MASACGPSEEAGDNNSSTNNRQTTPPANNATSPPANNQTTPEEVADPTLELLSPANGTVVEGDTQTIELGWEDGVLEALSYNVDGGADVVVDGPFAGASVAFDVEVTPGVHRYEFEAQFEGGLARSIELVLVKDAPAGGVLLVNAPIDGLEVDAGSVQLEGSVVSESEIAGVSVKRGDEQWDASLVTDGDVTDFTLELPLLLGDNAFEVIATTAKGVTFEEQFTVVRLEDQTPPEILASLPIDGHDVRGTGAYVRVDAVDNIEVVEVELLDEQGATIALTYEDEAFVGWLDLTPGMNSYTITARDAAGNEATLDRTVYQGHRLSSGGAHGGAIIDGVLHFWGRNNKGQVGLGYTSSLSNEDDGAHPTVPVALAAGASDFISISVTQNTSIALDASGHVWAWGDNDDGQLGLGTAAADDAFDDVDRLVPEKIGGLSDVVMIARGFDHTMALDASGHIWTWGKNADGQLGDGTTDDRDVPVQVPGLSNARLILGASATSYAVLDDGTVWAWGENTYGNLGGGVADDQAHPVPSQVPGLEDVIDLAAGRDHVIALTESGAIYTWGLNASNQASAGEDDILSPMLREDISGAVAVYAGGNQSFIEDARGRLFGWGQNFSGNLGLIDDGNMAAPTEAVFGVEETVSVAIGALQGLAMRRDGRAFAWGWSFEGSLGGGEGVINRWGYRVPILIALPEEGE
jgi:alpha-tubulin suppressor-like RCC1 family protein